MRSPSVPKIDAEGYERNVLACATELLWCGRAKDVSTEPREDGRTSVQEGGLPRLIRAGLPPPPWRQRGGGLGPCQPFAGARVGGWDACAGRGEEDGGRRGILNVNARSGIPEQGGVV